MASPFFSVLIPVYNHERYIGAALDSLLAQCDPDWEAVVVNDGSTDSTPVIIDEYARRDARIKVSHKSNGGTASALNHAIERAQGEWICWLSSDDLFLPHKLATHRQWIARNPECSYFYTNFSVLDEETGQSSRACSPQNDPRWLALNLLRGNYISGITICVRRILFDRYGVFDGTYGYAQDYDMHLRLLSAVEGLEIPLETCISRQHQAQGGRVQSSRVMFDGALVALRF